MKTSDFFFDLPSELIAQVPLKDRTASKLLWADKTTGQLKDKFFYEITDILKDGDLLILNDSKVLPARLYGNRKQTGGKVQFLLLKRLSENSWETLVKPGKKAKVGTEFTFSDKLSGKIIDTVDGGNRIIEFHYQGDFFEILDEVGEMPLPEYINTKLEEKDRYQTVYADQLGSAAAPTAGLHFTKELLNKLNAKGINHSFVTLHVGLGTFRPVKVEDVTNHKMHSEHYSVSTETAELIKKTKKDGGRVIAVGTTACRTLESVMQEKNEMTTADGDTSIFIYPGYDFKCIDGLITNFHLPESTLIMLVSSLLGREKTLEAYRHAVKNNYRFYSFGDAMLII